MLPADSDELVTNPYSFDHFCFRILPHTIIVNRQGRRFMDESGSYDACGLALANNEASGAQPYTAGDGAVFICDQTCVDANGYPGQYRGYDRDVLGMDMPDCTRAYDTLQELAEDEGIDAEGLLEEVERFNGFCETGVDLDFHRGEVPFSRPDGVAGLYSTIDETLPNPMLGKVETGPFYAVRYGMGSFGTSGGLAVDEHARVLKNGEPIPGLYACGCTAAGYSGYMGAGVSNGSGMHRSMRAADDALQLGVFPD